MDQHTTSISDSGWYTTEQLNQLLHDHVHEEVALIHVTELWEDSNMSKSAVLSHAPPNCQALMVHYHLQRGANWIPHYKALVQSNMTWYECESFAYRDTHMVQVLEDADWPSALKPQPNTSTTILCLVALDAYKAGLCMLKPNAAERTYTSDQQARDFTWVDGRTLHISQNPLRRLGRPVLPPPLTHTDKITSNTQHRCCKKPPPPAARVQPSKAATTSSHKASASANKHKKPQPKDRTTTITDPKSGSASAKVTQYF